MTEVLAGWYPDPAGGAVHRWWDGGRWTDSTSPIDPAAAPVYGRQAAPSNIGLSPAARITHEFSVAGPDYGLTHYGQPQLPDQAVSRAGRLPAARPGTGRPRHHRLSAAILLGLLMLLAVGTVALLVR